MDSSSGNWVRMKWITDLSVFSFVASTEAKYCSTELNLGELISFRLLDLPQRLVDEGEDVHPVKMSDLFKGRNPLGLRFLRRFRLVRTVAGDGLANERLEGGLVNFFSFVDVDRAA